MKVATVVFAVVDDLIVVIVVFVVVLVVVKNREIHNPNILSVHNEPCTLILKDLEHIPNAPIIRRKQQ